ncbi:hypothetical protein Tco_1563329 [Tanacetum coccineum]
MALPPLLPSVCCGRKLSPIYSKEGKLLGSPTWPGSVRRVRLWPYRSIGASGELDLPMLFVVVKDEEDG